MESHNLSQKRSPLLKDPVLKVPRQIAEAAALELVSPAWLPGRMPQAHVARSGRLFDITESGFEAYIYIIYTCAHAHMCIYGPVFRVATPPPHYGMGPPGPPPPQPETPSRQILAPTVPPPPRPPELAPRHPGTPMPRTSQP